MLKITSFKLAMLICMGLFADAAHADPNDDFINNLLTDLAPLIALFGEKVVMQFMSQSMGVADCVALAMAPIGVVTIIVSAIRVAGPTWLKAIIGRARENLSTAEIELMSSTSNEACELWNGRNVVRCPGSGQILQFICLVPKVSPCQGTKGDVPWEAICMTLDQAKASALLREIDMSDSAAVMSCTWSMISRIFGSNGTQSYTDDIESSNHGQLPEHIYQQSEQNSQRSRGSGRPPDNYSQQSESNSQQSDSNSQQSDSSSEQSDSRSQQSGSNSQQSGSNSQQSGNHGRPKAADQTSKIVIVRDRDDAAPNISLNCHNRHSRNEIILVAAVGVLIQTGVLVYCGFATRNSSLRHHLLKDDRLVRNYAFPLTVSGTIVLALGVFICGFVVERSTDESYYKANDDYEAYLVWLQKDSTISDQEFKPCAIYPTSRRTFITTSRRSKGTQSSHPAQNPPQGDAAAMTELKLLTTVGCLVSIFGFVLQFMGLRAMNYTAAIAQFVAMAIMTILRAVVRRGLVEAPIPQKLLKGFELDWLASSLESKQPEWMASKEDRSTPPGTAQVINPEANPGNENQSLNKISQKELLQANILSIRRELGNFVKWRGPALNQAVLLSEALKIVGSELLGQGKKPCEFHVFPQRDLWKLKFNLELKNKKWEALPDQIEAAISLWVSFLQTQRVVEKNDEKHDRFRAQGPRQLGLRILGKSYQRDVLMRNLHFHVPASLSASIPEVLRVEEKYPDNIEDRSTLEAISSHHVVGCGREASDPFLSENSADSRYFDVSKGFSMDAPESLHTQTDAGRQPGPETGLAHHNMPGSAVREYKDLDMAVYTHDGLERLFARQIFFAFMKSLSALDVHWVESPSEIVAKNGVYDWHALKINNKKLTDLVAKIHGTGFLSLEEAYFDVVTPLSLSNALLGDSAVVDHLQRQASQCIKDSDFDRLSEVLKTLFHLATAFDNNATDCMARAIAIFVYYHKFAEHIAKIAKREHRRAWYGISDFEKNSVRPFEAAKGASLSTLCSVFAGQFSMRSNLSRLDLSNMVLPDVERVKAFKLTEFHTWALEGSSEYPSNGDESSWLQQDIFAWTPIHYLAVSGQHTTDLRWDLRASFRKKSQDQFGFTPLHYACFREDEKTVQVLLDNGAPIEVQQLDGISPLHIAAVQSGAKTMDLILQTARARADKQRRKLYSVTRQEEPLTSLVGRRTDFDDRAAVHWAAIHGSLDAIKLLKQSLSLKDRYGWNCLHLALMHENDELADYLITEGGLDVNVTGHDDLTPLHLTIQRKQTATIGLLIKKRASINTKAANGRMPSHEAVDKCELIVVESLIENGAKINIQEEGSHCWNPIHYATRRGDLGILKRLLETDEGQKASPVKSASSSHLSVLLVRNHWWTQQQALTAIVMNNEQFRKMMLVNAAKASQAQDASPGQAGSSGGSSLGSRQRANIPMTPRAVGNGQVDFAKQLAQRTQQPNPSKQFKTAVPRGVKMAAGYTDRSKEREAEEARAADDRAERLKALEESLKNDEIDDETYERLRFEIAGGDLESTHLVKGLDFKLLERVRRGEDVFSGKKQDADEKQAEEADVDAAFDQIENQQVQAVEKEKTDKKKGHLSTVALASGKKRTRNQILAEFKAARAAAKATAEPALGDRFRKIGAKRQPGTRIERDSKGREVMIIIDADGHEKRKVRKLQPGDATGDADNGLLMPDEDAMPLGMEVPEHYRNKEPVLEEDEDVDIFDGVGDDYDPLAGMEASASDSEEGVRDIKDKDESAKADKSMAPPPRPKAHTDYFKGSKTSLLSEQENKAPSMSDPAMMAAIKRAAALRPRDTGDDDDSASDDEASQKNRADEARRKKLLQNVDRDAEDMDMGFGTSRYEDEADFDDRDIKLSAWGDDGDGEEGGGGGGGKKRKRNRKRKGDVNNAADVLRVMEQRKS
ncbi:hypothetical protein LLEC1_01715 [Akanthomyces lecanii]|uniref:RED-like N-terminal domain-containing protein n=1 Tax=Cordyceps confragosa TaxID=2714763 RepID=A0A179IB60_CORDF|nr:hypothetical protein LLEC1_01715 [Akanthomyces lecanii]